MVVIKTEKSLVTDIRTGAVLIRFFGHLPQQAYN